MWVPKPRSILAGSKRFAKAWTNWWMREAEPHALGIARAFLGFWILLYWALKAPDIPATFSNVGVVLPLPTPYFDWLLVPPSPLVAYMVYSVLLVCLALIMIGHWTRRAAFVAAMICFYYNQLSLHMFHTSFDRLFTFCLLTFILDGSDRFLSYRMYKKHGSIWAWEYLPHMVGHRMIQIQVFLVYLGTGFHKLWLPGWQGGQILWFSFIGCWGTPLAFWIADTFQWSNLYHVAVNMVIMFDIFMPIGMWIKKAGLRWWAYAWGTWYHTSITFTMGFWWFQALIPSYILFFGTDEIHRFAIWLSRGGVQTKSDPR